MTQPRKCTITRHTFSKMTTNGMCHRIKTYYLEEGQGTQLILVATLFPDGELAYLWNNHYMSSRVVAAAISGTEQTRRDILENPSQV